MYGGLQLGVFAGCVVGGPEGVPPLRFEREAPAQAPGTTAGEGVARGGGIAEGAGVTTLDVDGGGAGTVGSA